MKSRLLYFALLAGWAAAESFAENTSNLRSNVESSRGTQSLEREQAIIWERVKYVVVEKVATTRRVILERIAESTTPVEGATAVLSVLGPTTAPRKRQDTGQIQALSGQIAQLSVSLSAASSASQSISQSAQQVQQSADQASRDNSQALSRTQSSALSAVAQASQQASSQIAQAVSSASSQNSRNLASVQSSASSAISVAQASASVSMASAINVAMSQLQAARAEATAIKSDANNFADQVQRNAISTTNLAIIVATSVSGAVVLTSIIVCVFLRYRRKKRDARDGRSSTPDEEGHDKPIAVRGSMGASRFNPFSGSASSLERLKLPTSGLRSAREDEPLNFGFAISDYSDMKEKPPVEGEVQGNGTDEFSSTSFRLQKPPNVKSAEAIRVIRVNSRKDKKQAAGETTGQDRLVPEPPKPAPTQPESDLERKRTEVARKPVAAVSDPTEQSREDKRQTTASTAPTEPPRDNRRDTAASGISAKTRASSRYTMISTATIESPQPSAPRNSTSRYTMASQPETEDGPGWRPPSSRTSRANSFKSINTAQRLAFRDSGDPVPEPDATGWKQPKSGFSMASVSSLMRSDSANMNDRQPTLPKLAPKGPKKQGPSFAAFPTVRNGPPSTVAASMLNRPRPRPALVGKREDAERKLREKEKGAEE